MKKKLIPFLGLLTWINIIRSQTVKIEKEEWDSKPAIHALDPGYTRESAVIIFEKSRYEYVDRPKDEVDEYYTFHRIIHLNDDQGIEVFNKIYLGVGAETDLIDVRARTILPSGKVVEMIQDNIKDLKEEDGNIYKIFAMEGLEKGCEIEYLYSYKKPSSYFGREIIQSRYPVLESNLELIGPDRLQFEMKSYNLDRQASDTTINSKKALVFNVKNIPELEEEKYASYEANLERVEFKLSYNNSASKEQRLFTWNDLAKRIYSMYTVFSDKETRKVKDLLEARGWNSIKDETGKITAVENYIKKNIAFREELEGDDGSVLDKVIQNKVAGVIGITRLYISVFQQLNVNIQIVLTGNRDKFVIDRDFENWSNCDYPVIYFTAENKCIAPTRPDFRYPLVLPAWGATNGLFCKDVSIGGNKSALAEVRELELEDYHKSYRKIESHIKFNSGLDSLKIDANQLYGGYTASTYREIFNFANADEIKSVTKDLAKAVSGSEHILFSEVKNKGFEDGNADLPFIFHSVTESGELLENAGNKILIKIGLAIGPQVEMYQEKARRQPISMEYPHFEERDLELEIPEGYIVKNPGDLKISQTYLEGNETTMGFVSSYILKGDLLKIHIMEEYHRAAYPLTQFDEFKKIINASSDFNKVVLVLEKK